MPKASGCTETNTGRTKRAPDLAVAVLVALLGCGGSSPPSLSHGTQNGSSSSGGGSGSGSGSIGSGDGGGSGAGDDAGDDASQDDGSIDYGDNWACPSSLIFGDYPASCVRCIQTMCATPLQQCQTSACSVCEGPTFACESQMCNSECVPGGGGGGGSSGGGAGSGSSSGGGGGSSGATSSVCAGLMTCCGYIAMASPSEGASCTAVAESGSTTECQGVIATLPASIQGLCQ